VPVVAMSLGSPVGGSGLTDNFGYRYDVTIPAGETVRVMLFNEMSEVMSGALAAAPDFETLAAANTAGLLTGLTATELSEIVNYETDADLDGVGDSTDTAPNDATQSTSTSSGSGSISPTGLLTLLGLPILFRHRKNKKRSS